MDENRTKKSISLTIISERHAQELFEDIYSSGFDCIEFGLNVSVSSHLPQRKADALQKKLLGNIKKISKTAKYYECQINSCHMPFGYNLDISSPDEKTRTKAVKKLSKIVKKAECTGANYFVFHPGSAEWVKGSHRRVKLKEEERQDRLESVIKSFVELSRTTDVKLAVENMPYNLLASTPEEQIYIIDTVNRINQNQGFADKQIGAIVDVNHCGEASPEETILALNDRIVGFHLSDKKEGTQDQHMAIGTGDLNWNGIFSAIEQVGYRGVLTDESRTREMVPSCWYLSCAMLKYGNDKKAVAEQNETSTQVEQVNIPYIQEEDFDPDQLRINFDDENYQVY